MKPIKRTQRFIRHYQERITRNDQLRQEFLDAVDTFYMNPVPSMTMRSRAN